MYWIWITGAQNESQACIHGQPEVIERLDIEFDNGLPITIEVPHIEIIVEPEYEGIYTDNLIAMGVPGLVFNQKLSDVISGAGVDNIEYFPVSVKIASTGKLITGYQIANVVGRIDCIDPASELQRDDLGDIRFIDHLILDHSKIHGMLIFRLAEYLPLVVVHDRVKQAIENVGITGIDFYLPEKLVL
ncbi:MAG: hypothetical protein JW841_08715 [Deltaproteobacteria bacterium]|nr:hypothetical protein [Deltaproteobacteria bacterium]